MTTNPIHTCPRCGLKKHSKHALCSACRSQVCPVCGGRKQRWHMCCPAHLLEVGVDVRSRLMSAEPMERQRMLAALANMDSEQRRAWDGEVV